MFKALDFKWANTLFGCVALVMMPIPFVHFFSSKTFVVISHWLISKSVPRSFSFMDQLSESEVNFHVLSWVCRTHSTSFFFRNSIQCNDQSSKCRVIYSVTIKYSFGKQFGFRSWSHLLLSTIGWVPYSIPESRMSGRKLILRPHRRKREVLSVPKKAWRFIFFWNLS